MFKLSKIFFTAALLNSLRLSAIINTDLNKYQSIISYDNKITKELDLVKNSNLEFAFVPDTVANAIFSLTDYFQLAAYSKKFQEVYLALRQNFRTIEYSNMRAAIAEALTTLTKYEHNNDNSEYLALKNELIRYQQDLTNKNALIFLGPEETTRSGNKCELFCNLLVRDCLRASSINATNITSNNVTITGSLILDGITINPNTLKSTGFTGVTGPTVNIGELTYGIMRTNVHVLADENYQTLISTPTLAPGIYLVSFNSWFQNTNNTSNSVVEFNLHINDTPTLNRITVGAINLKTSTSENATPIPSSANICVIIPLQEFGVITAKVKSAKRFTKINKAKELSIDINDVSLHYVKIG